MRREKRDRRHFKRMRFPPFDDVIYFFIIKKKNQKYCFLIYYKVKKKIFKNKFFMIKIE